MMHFASDRQMSFFQKPLWPHPITDKWKATPETLSQAGFYFDPTTTDKPPSDNVSCYLCKASLDGWTEEDDPMREHEVHSPACPLVLLHTSKSVTSAKKEQARLATFGNWWPHNGKNITSKKMAKAGFIFCGSEESPDATKCLNCELTLDGWEDDDNPIDEHQRRNSSCSFFSRKRTKKTTEKEDLPPKKASRARSSSRSSVASSTRSSSVLPGEVSISTTASSTRSSSRRTRASARMNDSIHDEDRLSDVSISSSTRSSSRCRKPAKESDILNTDMMQATLEEVASRLASEPEDKRQSPKKRTRSKNTPTEPKAKKARKPRVKKAETVEEEMENKTTIAEEIAEKQNEPSIKPATPKIIDQEPIVENDIQEESELMSDLSLSAEELEMTVEEYLKTLHEREIARMLEMAEEKISDFQRFYESQLERLKTVAIIGAGSVGAAVCYALLLRQIAAELLLVDIDVSRAQGECADLSDGTFLSNTTVRVGTPAEAGKCDIIVITAGAKQRDGETRVQLIDRNFNILKSVINSMKPLNPNAIILLVANPVDILTFFAQKLSGLPPNQVFGSGTFLDTARLRGAISRKLGVADTAVHAYVLGEHGDSQFVAWSSANVGTIPLSNFSEVSSEEVRKEIANKTKNKAYEIIKAKGATYFGIAACVSSLCEAVFMNQNHIRPLSVFHPELKVCLSVPCVLGCTGIKRVLPLNLNEAENAQLKSSAEALYQIIQKYEPLLNS